MLERRFAECGLTLHPDKTKVVYCKDDDRRGNFPDHKFNFLGYEFWPRLSRRRNGHGFGVSFSPAVNGKALKSIRQTVRHWILHERSDKTLDDLARMFNNHIRGWINYYDHFYKSALFPPCGTSTAFWHDGRIGSSSPSDAKSDGHITGCCTSCGVSLICLLTGEFCMDVAEQ